MPKDQSQTSAKSSSVSISRLWVHGALYIVAILVLWYFIHPAVSWLMDITGNRNAFIASAAFIVIGPLICGWLDLKLVRPLFRKWGKLKDITQWEDRVVQELSPDEERRFPVVLVPWPSEQVKTLGVLSRIHESRDAGEKLASVYLPGSPDPSSGFLRVVPVDQLVYTDWAVKDLLRHQGTFGTAGPELFG